MTMKSDELFDLYLRCDKEFDPIGHLQKFPVVDDGVTAKKAFKSFDGQGKLLSTTEPDLLARVLRGKASLNLNIKLWAEGISEGVFCIIEFQEDYPWLPEWVWNAVKGQCGPIMKPFEWYYRLIFDELVESIVIDKNTRKLVKPCPVCHRELILIRVRDPHKKDWGEWRVFCNNCYGQDGCGYETDDYETEIEAIHAHNKIKS